METLYTFEDLGFHDFISIIVPHFPQGAYRYTTLKIKKDANAVKEFLLHSLITYMRTAGEGHDFAGEFFGGVAYMMDGSLIIAYNGMDADADKLYAQGIEPDHYANVQTPDGQSFADNKEFISTMFNIRIPKGLSLIQEIESPDPECYHFRIIHARATDER